MIISPDIIVSLIDHTLLKSYATKDDIIQLCHQAKKHKFKAVCINPSWVRIAAQALTGSPVQICTVVGFPLGANTTETKINEAIEAIRDGANEIDLVINIGLLKGNSPDLFFQDLNKVIKAINSENSGTVIKTIIETCFLNPREIVAASKLCEKAGAHIIKTSTGFGSGGAKVEDIILIKNSISANTGIKASGGISSLDLLISMYNAGATRIGTSSGLQIIREINEKYSSDKIT
ncbi:MAG: deoxyribose-phosphate aldolase [Peptococcaceae bacterium]|nr:deoxyribose-phosphate aldolase [Peptococcaceae bacterium]